MPAPSFGGWRFSASWHGGVYRLGEQLLDLGDRGVGVVGLLRDEHGQQLVAEVDACGLQLGARDAHLLGQVDAALKLGLLALGLLQLVLRALQVVHARQLLGLGALVVCLLRKLLADALFELLALARELLLHDGVHLVVGVGLTCWLRL